MLSLAKWSKAPKLSIKSRASRPEPRASIKMFLPKTSSSRKPLSLNNIALPGTVWLASDMHLSAATPGTRDAFLRFLEQACAQADALFLCGDIFDAWIGDDLALQDPPLWLQTILQALSRTAATLPVWLGRGNRDFLVGR